MTSNNWHHLDVAATLTQLQTSGDGLTSSEAANRLARGGRNEIRAAQTDRAVAFAGQTVYQFSS